MATKSSASSSKVRAPTDQGGSARGSNGQPHDAVEASEAAVWELGRLISGSELDGETFEVLAEQIRPLLPFDRISLSVLDGPSRFRVFQSHGVGVEGRETGMALSGPGALAEHIVDTGETMVVDDATDLQSKYPGVSNSRRAGLLSLVATPLVTDSGTTLGVLSFWSAKRGQYGPVDRRIAEAVASQLVNPVEAASLRDTLESEQRNRQILNRIGEILSGSASLEDAFDRLAEQIQQIMPVERVVVTVLDPATGQLIDRMIHGEGVGERDSRPEPEMLAGPTSEGVIKSGASRKISAEEMAEVDDESDPGLAASYGAGFRSAMYSVLRYNRRTIGTLNVKSKTVDDFEDWHLATLDQIAAQLSGVVAAFEAELLADQTREEQQAVRDVTRIIGSSLNVQDVFARFAQELNKLIPADRVVISTVDEERDEVEDAYVAGEDIPGWGAGETHRLSGSLTEEIVRSGRAALLDEMSSRIHAEQYSAQAAGLAAGLQSMLAAPLIFEGQVVGTLNLRSRQEHAYTDHHLAILELIGPQIAGAIANERLNAQLRRKIETESILAEIGELLISAREDGDMFGPLTENVSKLLHADLAFLREIDRDNRTLINLDVPGGDEGIREDYEGTVAERVVADGEPFVINPDTFEQTVKQFPSLTPLIGMGVKCGVVVPMTYDRRKIGVLGAWRKYELPFAPEDVDLAARVADIVTGAVVNRKLNAQLLSQVETESILAEIGTLLISGQTGGDVFKAITTNVRKLLRADAVMLRSIDEATGLITNLDVSGDSAFDLIPGAQEELEGTVSGAVAASGRTYVFYPESIEETYEQNPTLSPLEKEGMRSGVVVPLLYEGSAVGTLAAWRGSDHKFTDDEVNLAERVANLVTGELVQERLNEELRTRAQAESILAEIGEILNSAHEGRELFERITSNVKRLLRADVVALREIDVEAGIITNLDASGEGLLGLFPGDKERLEGTVAEAAIKDGQTRIYNAEEFQAEARRFRTLKVIARQGVKSGLVVPLTFQGVGVGILAAWRMSDLTMSDEDIELATRVSDLVSSAVVQNRLRASLRREAQVQATLNEIARTMSSDLEIGNVFDSFASQVSNLVKVDRLVLAIWDEEQDVLIDKYIYGTRIPNWDRRPAHSAVNKPTAEAISLGQAVVLEIDETDDPSVGALTAAGADVGLKTAAFVPLISDGVAIGTLNVKSAEKSAYSEADISLLQRIADQIAGPVAASELHQKTIALSRERELRLEAESERRQLQRADEERSKFLSTVSHELRTPLAAMVAFADLLAANRRGNLAPRQVEMADTIRRNGDRLARLVDDLLDISRLQAGNLELQRTQVNPAEVLHTLLTDLKPLIDAKGQKLATWVRSKLDPVWADEPRLTQVLSNLISNASKYSAPGSSIGVRVDRRRDLLRISVKDEGIGITKRDQERLFTPFFRADNRETKSVPGTGLGLAISSSLIEMHGGRILVESERRRGSKFTVEIPLGTPTTEELEEAARSSNSSGHASAGTAAD